MDTTVRLHLPVGNGEMVPTARHPVGQSGPMQMQVGRSDPDRTVNDGLERRS